MRPDASHRIASVDTQRINGRHGFRPARRSRRMLQDEEAALAQLAGVAPRIDDDRSF
jgi:hypothetical protein